MKGKIENLIQKIYVKLLIVVAAISYLFAVYLYFRYEQGISHIASEQDSLTVQIKELREEIKVNRQLIIKHVNPEAQAIEDILRLADKYKKDTTTVK